MHGHAQIPVLVLVGNAHGVWSKAYWSERLLLTSVGFGSGPWKSVSMKRMHLLWPWFSKVFEYAHSVSTCVWSCWYTHVFIVTQTLAYLLELGPSRAPTLSELGEDLFPGRKRGLAPSSVELQKPTLYKGNPYKKLVFLAQGYPNWLSRSIAGVGNRILSYS